MTRIDDVLGRLDNVHRSSDSEATANCPCHASKSKKSLSVSVGDDGRILIHCFGGCDPERIVEAIGLEMSDLMPERDARPAPSRQRTGGTFTSAGKALDVYRAKLGTTSAVYEYHDAGGTLVGLVARWDTANGKEIRPVSKNGTGWILKAMPEPRPLYRLPEVTKAKVVFVVEGEKAADALRSIGYTATTSPGGSKAPRTADWSPLAGKTVFLWPDADEPGKEYVEAVAEKLSALNPSPTVKRIAWAKAGPGDDAADFIAGEGTNAANEVSGLMEFSTDVRTVETSVTFTPQTAAAMVTKFPDLRPVVIEGLLRQGETANVVSVTKVGKSWLTLNLALSVALGWPWLGHWTRAGRVLLLDNELHAETLSYRIRTVAEAMGTAAPNNLFVVPLRGQLQDVESIAAALGDVPHGYYALAILDAFYRAIPEGTSENDNAQMAGIYNEIDRLADALGAAVVLVHHSTKGSQSEKRVTDVGSGAGSISRAVDTHIVLREHEETDVFVMSAALRSFPPAEPQCVRREHPLFVQDSSIDAAKLKSSRVSKSETAAARDERMLAILDEQTSPTSTAELAAKTHMNGSNAKSSLIRLHDAGKTRCWHKGEIVESIPDRATLTWLRI